MGLCSVHQSHRFCHLFLIALEATAHLEAPAAEKKWGAPRMAHHTYTEVRTATQRGPEINTASEKATSKNAVNKKKKQNVDLTSAVKDKIR